MKHLAIRLLVGIWLGLAAGGAWAFSMLGIPDTWQTVALGYNASGTEPGGPMGLGEEYRWGLKQVYYSFDQSFLLYFGDQGAAAVDQAFAVLNALPAVSTMSANLSEYPLRAREINAKARALGVIDVKSTVLSKLVNDMGLAQPERFIWTLYNRVTIGALTNYYVIKRNFDPVSRAPTNVVNGVLYTYYITDTGATSDAVEVASDPRQLERRAIAAFGEPAQGEYFTGLTRDDAGGLRHLYWPYRFAVEPLPTGVTNLLVTNMVSGYQIYFPSNYTGPTNLFWTGLTNATNSVLSTNFNIALRPGVDKVTFTRVDYDSLLSQNFPATTNTYTDTIVSNYFFVTHDVRRVITQPDILFTAGPLGFDNFGSPVLVSNTPARGPSYVNNDAVNGQVTQAGPGSIGGPIRIQLTTILPYYRNSSGFLPGLTEEEAEKSGTWGSFNVGTNVVVYPNWFSLQALESQVLGGF